MKHKLILSLILSLLIALLFSLTANAVDETGRVVVLLDPGHSEGDGGGTYAGEHLECWYNMQIALACKEALEENGNFSVYLSHPDNNTAATNLERGQSADRVNADVILSIHIDGNEFYSSMSGAEVFQSVLPEFVPVGLGEAILDRLEKMTPLSARGIYQREDSGDGENIYYWNSDRQWDVPNDRSLGLLSDYYGIITWGAKFGIPALIVEHGFMTNSADKKIVENPENLVAMGRADAEALISYFAEHTHEWSETRQCDYPTNCCLAGKESFRCSVCGARKGTVSLSAPTENDHYYVVTAHKEKTCTSDGYTTYTCRIAQNLTEKGYNVGEHVYTVTDPAEGHQYKVTLDQDVTHTENGIHTEVCSVCGDVKSVVTKAEGHLWEFDSHGDPTCAEDGYDCSICTICGEKKTVKLPAKGHEWFLDSHKDSTCGEEGFDRFVCSVCGDSYEKTIPALAHSYEIREERTATCTEGGVSVRICTVCGEEIREETPTSGHVMTKKTIKEPTCEEAGSSLEICSVCGEEILRELPPLGHDWDEGQILKKNTFFLDGEQLFTCKIDSSHQYTEILPQKATKLQKILLFAGLPEVLILPVLILIFVINRKKKQRKNNMQSETPQPSLIDR